MLVSSTEQANSLLETRTVSCASPTVNTHVAPLAGNGRLIIPVARDALAQTFYVGVFKCSKPIYYNKTYS